MIDRWFPVRISYEADVDRLLAAGANEVAVVELHAARALAGAVIARMRRSPPTA